MSLDVLKELFIRGLAYSKKMTGFYYDTHELLCDVQSKLVLNATTHSEFAHAVQIYNYTREFGYVRGPKLCPGNILEFTNFQFGSGIHGSYTMSGSTDSYGFLFCISRNEIAPPAVVKEMNLDPEDGVIWFLGGGYGVKGSNKWNAVPFEYLEKGHYEKWSKRTFYFDAIGKDIDNVQFTSTEPMRFDLDVLYTGTDTHHVTATFLAKSPPKVIADSTVINQHEKASYMYPFMSVELSVDDLPSETGHAFIQHVMYTPPVGITWIQATRAIQRIIPLTYTHTLQIFLQFQEQQYLLGVFLTAPIQSGQLLNLPYSAIRYSYGRTSDVTFTSPMISVTTTIVLNNITFPAGLLIKLGADSIECRSDFLEGLTGNSSHQANYHSSLLIKDTNFNSGIGLITMGNTLSIDQWSALTFGDQHVKAGGSLLINQPRISYSNQQLARVFLVLPYALIASALVMLLLLVFIISLKRFKKNV